jgi:uncharacterized membrane protein YgcG
MKKNNRRRFAVLIVCMLMSMGWMACADAQGISYDTLDYHVDLVVRENNTFSVTETITVDFLSPAHGIYRYITVGGEIFFNDENGNLASIPGNLKLSNISAADVELDYSSDSDNAILRLGSPNFTLTGLKTYTLSYDAAAYDDGLELFDQVYWDLIPTGWETPIEHASFTVTMPKDFDLEAMDIITGATGSGDESRVVWSKAGNVVSGEVVGMLNTYEGVTFRVLLPEGYFVNERTDTWMALLSIAASTAAAFAALFLFLRFGKDKKVIPVVEFYPPDDLSPAEVGYVLDGSANKNDIISLVPYFAEKGYMEIRRLEPKKKFLSSDIEQYEFNKLKDLPQDAPEYQKIFFDGLFSYGNPVNINDIPAEFGNTFLASQGFLKSYFDGNKKTQVFEMSSKIATGAGIFLSLIPLVGFSMLAATAVLKREVFMLALAMGAAAFLIAVICTVFMRRRSDYSLLLLGRLKGFKNFIKAADLDRINALVNEDPKYFYNILPYAYVFGLTKEWMEHFEGLAIPAPTWYSDNIGTFHMLYLMNSFSRIAETLPTAAPPAEGSFGGGGSSGGGFSGGGFGGGGGGAW